jgi:hypothetical protein
MHYILLMIVIGKHRSFCPVEALGTLFFGWRCSTNATVITQPGKNEELSLCSEFVKVQGTLSFLLETLAICDGEVAQSSRSALQPSRRVVHLLTLSSYSWSGFILRMF